MKSIKEIYPDYNKIYWYKLNYDDILLSFEYDILLKIDDNDFLGKNSCVLLKNVDKYGLLLYDNNPDSRNNDLSNCKNPEDIEEQQAYLHNQIRWFHSPESCIKYMVCADWGLDYAWNYDSIVKFLLECTDVLIKIIKGEKNDSTNY